MPAKLLPALALGLLTASSMSNPIAAVPEGIVLFRFELNVRVSTVLGLVGAGGIGFLLITYMRGAEYAKVTAVIAAIVILVMALDAISTRLRKLVN